MRFLCCGYLYENKYVIWFLKIMKALLPLQKKRPLPELVTKILILKPDHLGDLLLASSVLPLIRERYPKAQIDLVCRRSSQSLL